MSSLLKEEMQKRVFRPKGQRLEEFIEITESAQKRHFLCLSVATNKDVRISVVKYTRSSAEDQYETMQEWFLKDLVLLDGKNSDTDDPRFVMHFGTVHPMTAVSCAAKYSLARALVALSDSHGQKGLQVVNFDKTYIQPTSVYSNRGDCMVLMQICFYAFNLVCLSLCPAP
ncbi:exocyst complex component 1-like [Arapaima gigas]